VKYIQKQNFTDLCSTVTVNKHAIKQTWGDYSTNVIDYDYLPPARLRLRINKIAM